MAETSRGKSNGKPVAVVIGATSKWQADGRNTRLIEYKQAAVTGTGVT